MRRSLGSNDPMDHEVGMIAFEISIDGQKT